jgi:hypothetical protein
MMNSLHYLLLAGLLTDAVACSNSSPSPSAPPSVVRPTPATPRSSAATGRIFVYADRRSELAEIFDFERRLLVSGGDEIQRDPGRAENEFSGPLDSCDDSQFLCLETGLHIAVPRNRIREFWSVSGLSCQARPTNDPEGTFGVVCRVDGQPSSVHFLYSGARGVISYSRLCPQCRPEEFVLVGERGIFARAR